MWHAIKIAGVACLSLLVLSQAVAQTAPPSASEQPYTFQTATVIRVSSDHRADLEYVFRGNVLTAAGIQTLGTYRETYNAHFTTLEVVDGATIKADGRRVPIDRSKLIEQAAAASPDALHFFVDLKTTTIIFPEVEVGDQVEARLRLRSIKPYLPGGYSNAYVFSRTTRRSEATYEVRVPKTLPFQAHADGVERHAPRFEGEEVIHRFEYRGQPYQPNQADSIHPLDFEPYFAFSTFADWNAVGQAFWERGATKAEPSAEIAAKAREITQGLNDNRAKAEAVFNWVSSKVRYVNIVLGAGGWVPREAGSVLSNLFGDCKDHVTLTRAMLTSLGIGSEYALVNAASIYRPAPVPLTLFDHIILYLPEFGLYIDPTVTNGQFGETDLRLQGKPVLHISATGSRYERIPVLPAARNNWVFNANVAIAADGSASGESELKARSVGAVFARSLVTQLSNAGLEASATRRLNQQNWRGKARYLVDPPSGDRKPEVRIRAEFQILGSLANAGETGARLPVLLLPTARPSARLGQLIRMEANMPFSCIPVRWEEQVAIRLPEGRKLSRLPENVQVASGGVSYTAQYSFSDKILHVSRLFVWEQGEPVCTLASIAPYRAVLMAARRDLNRARLMVASDATMPKPAESNGDDDNE
jgi:hypothetical protein